MGYSDGETSAVYTYDGAGRKVSETVDYGPFVKTNTYAYLKNGLKKSFTGPDGITYTYLYDGNRLAGVQIPGEGFVTVNSYNWDRPASITLPGGAARRYIYDPLMRIKRITSLDPGGNMVMDYGYEYDTMGNITVKATEHGDYIYTYDALHRLTGADNPDASGLADETFTYDAVGNRLGSNDTAGQWRYNDNNELTGYDNVFFEYDSNGNMTQKTVDGVVTNYVYNTEDRLSEVRDGSGSLIASYYYDPFGRRLWKEAGGTRTYYHYADEGLVAELAPSGNVLKSYGYKPGGTWSTDPLFMKVGGNYYFYHNDHLGTPQKMTAKSGAVVWSAKYSSFGEASVDAGSTIENNLRFPGQYYDEERGLHYNWNRYYDPWTGRYLRPDPIGLAGGVNLFTYVLNDPVNFTDPYGLLTTYYGGGAAAYYGNAGNATASAGAILYSDKTGWLGGNFVSYGAEKAPLGDIETTLGAGAGAGPVFGFMTGSADAFKGKASNLTLDLYFFGVTYTTNGSEWGLSVGFGGKGVGLGYYMNETNTIISGEKSNPCK